MARRKNIFIVGLDDFHLAQLKLVKNADDYNFLPLFRYEEIRGVDEFPVPARLHEAEQSLAEFSEPIDAIIGYWDFPVSTMLPLIRRRFGLRTPSLESVFKCEHKYWSRLEQAEVIGQSVPQFVAVDPFAEDPLLGLEMAYPFWLKPVKAVLSQLGFLIHDERAFRESIAIIQQKIGRFAEPFNYLLSQAELPRQIARVDGYHCIAEEIIATGRQCTIEGYVFEGEVHIYGAVDSVREGPQGSCFSSYRYPSVLPANVLARMNDISRRIISHIGYDNAPFNIEYFWNESQDRIWLLEINPRISKSHCPLFQLVDGAYHHEINIDLALGRCPDFPHRQGRFNCAAKFMLRKYADAWVTKAPSCDDIARIQERWPDVLIQCPLQEGMRLSQLRDQDSYSYEIAVLFVGADNEQALLEKYKACLDMLPLEFSKPIPPSQ